MSSGHCVCPGAQLPLHWPLTHVLLLAAQSAPVVHPPFASHVCGLLPEHDVCPGAHTPVHAFVTQVWLVHATGDPHWPVESQVSTPLLTHRVSPLAHIPWHEAVPPLCTQV
jgi:hypothetical protein